MNQVLFHANNEANVQLSDLGVVSGELNVPNPQRWYARYLTSNWSSNFIIESAKASLTISAWVRGAPGTEYVSLVEHSGLWTGTVQDSGKASLSGFGTSVASCQDCVVALPFLVSSSELPHVASGPTHTFDEYPGVVYTRVDFLAPASAYSLTQDVSVLAHSGSESCILFCGNPSEVVRSGSMMSSARVFLPFSRPWATEQFTIVARVPCDLDGDGLVGATDLGAPLASWGPCPVVEDCPADFTKDGIVGAAGLAVLLGAWS